MRQRVGAGEGYSASVIDLDSEAFGQKAVGFRKGSGDDVWEGTSDAGCQGVGQGGFSNGEKQREARGRQEWAFEVSSTGLATSAAVALFPFFPVGGRPEPAA